MHDRMLFTDKTEDRQHGPSYR